MLAMEMFPDWLPAEAGPNATVKLPLCPGVSVKAPEDPAVLKPDPAAVMLETVRFAVPELDTVMSCESVLPTITLPKFTEEGLREI